MYTSGAGAHGNATMRMLPTFEGVMVCPLWMDLPVGNADEGSDLLTDD